MKAALPESVRNPDKLAAKVRPEQRATMLAATCAQSLAAALVTPPVLLFHGALPECK